MARFISIDNNYAGEAEDINTQNRYVYTLNNPYKYVDTDGEKAKKKYPLEAITTYGSKVPTVTAKYKNGYQVSTSWKQNADGTVTVVTTNGYAEIVSDKDALKRARNMGLAIIGEPIVCKNKSNGNGYDASAERKKAAGKFFGDFLGGVGNFFKDQWDSIANLYSQVKDYGFLETLKAIYENGINYLTNFSKDDAIAIYNQFSRFNISIDKVVSLMINNFDVDKMAEDYGYSSFGDWYGRIVTEGLTLIGLEKLATFLKDKFPSKGGNGADDVLDDAFKPIIKITLKDIANSIRNKFNGVLTELKNGYKIEIPNGKKPIVVRVMDEGSGGRSAPYFRVSIDGKGSLTLDGILSNERALTHINLTDNYLEQITNMIKKYKGGK